MLLSTKSFITSTGYTLIHRDHLVLFVVQAKAIVEMLQTLIAEGLCNALSFFTMCLPAVTLYFKSQRLLYELFL